MVILSPSDKLRTEFLTPLGVRTSFVSSPVASILLVNDIYAFRFIIILKEMIMGLLKHRFICGIRDEEGCER
jgi:hypothetical protein